MTGMITVCVAIVGTSTITAVTVHVMAMGQSAAGAW
jgi:hypothetical protein